MTLQLVTDPLNRTLIYRDDDEDVVHCVLTDPDYRRLRTYDCPVDRGDNAFAAMLSQVLFPFSLVRKSWNSDYVLFRLEWGGTLGLIGIALALGVLAWIRAARSLPFRQGWVDWVAVALLGLYGLLAVLVVGREPAGR